MNRARPSLIDEAGVTDTLSPGSATESAWIEVIHKMDAVYADLVRYQVELERKNSALEEAQQFIRSVLAAMTDVLIVCDIQGRVQQVNRALEDLTGKPEASLLNRHVAELFGAESRELAERFPEKLGLDALVDCEVALIAADGKPTPLAMNCSSRYDYEGGLVGMVLIGRPVGELRRAYDALNEAHLELKQTQSQLVHSEKMASLGRLVAGVAHELNNPISVVFGNMHALQRYGERIARYLAEVDGEAASPRLRARRAELRIDRILEDMGPLIEGTLEGAERVRDIVQELRLYSSNRQEPEGDFDLPQVIQTAVQWVVSASRRKPEVDYDLPESLPVKGRKGHVHQILVNLVQNAVDVMEGQAQSRLSIACERGGGRARVRVRDHGPGIQEQDLPKVFDPFYTTKPVGKGTGLGLYICYGLAKDLGGDLSVANHPEGGAVLTLTLPVGETERDR